MHQRMGYGRAMLEALETRAKICGFRFANVETTTTQGAALKLYVSEGYRQIGKIKVRGFEVRQFAKRLESPIS
jgi:ribosomal protein S18 acetylase RimI-like enzyme